MHPMAISYIFVPMFMILTFQHEAFDIVNHIQIQIFEKNPKDQYLKVHL